MRRGQDTELGDQDLPELFMSSQRLGIVARGNVQLEQESVRALP